MSREKVLEALFVISMAFLVLFFVFKTDWLDWDWEQRNAWLLDNWAMMAALGIGLIGIFIKSAARLIAMGWMKLAEVIGFVMSNVILSVTFLAFLSPLAIVYRLFTKDALKLKKGGRSSYYENRDHKYTAEDIDKTW